MLGRFIGLAIGAAYILLAVFLALLATGGGHGNFGWLFLFSPGFVGGLFYPVAGFLAADLRSGNSRLVLGIVMTVNYILTVFMLYGIRADILPDFKETLIFQLGSVLFMAAVYLSAHIVLWGVFLFALTVKKGTEENDNGIISLLS
jgi:hypothetical protein